MLVLILCSMGLMAFITPIPNIFQDEVPREVRGPRGHASVRNITVQDETASIPVALWNTAATHFPIKTGDRVKITRLSQKRQFLAKNNTYLFCKYTNQGMFSIT